MGCSRRARRARCDSAAGATAPARSLELGRYRDVLYLLARTVVRMAAIDDVGNILPGIVIAATSENAGHVGELNVRYTFFLLSPARSDGRVNVVANYSSSASRGRGARGRWVPLQNCTRPRPSSDLGRLKLGCVFCCPPCTRTRPRCRVASLLESAGRFLPPTLLRRPTPGRPGPCPRARRPLACVFPG